MPSSDEDMDDDKSSKDEHLYNSSQPQASNSVRLFVNSVLSIFTHRPYSPPVVRENNDEEYKHDLQRKERLKKIEAQIAAEKAQTEAILERRKEAKQKEEVEATRFAIECEEKNKESNFRRQETLKKFEYERQKKEDQLEEEHKQRLLENEMAKEESIRAFESEIKIIEKRMEEQKIAAEQQKINLKKEFDAKMEEIWQRGKALELELAKLKTEQEKESKEWIASYEESLKKIKMEEQNAIDSHREAEEIQLQKLKRLNDSEEQKLNNLSKTLSELQSVVGQKVEAKIEKIAPESAVQQQQPIQVENPWKANKIEISNTDGKLNIAVIGLPKSGRSYLIGGLAGGVRPKDIKENPVSTENGKIYKLSYPNNGFINGSVEENRPIYEEFFHRSKLTSLSTLIVTIYGSVREEDYLVLCLAKEFNIPTVIVRTKLDEWLDNRPQNQSKEEYIEQDKEYVINTLKKLNFDFSKERVLNISSFACIKAFPNNREQDERALFAILKGEMPNSNNALVAVLGLTGAGKSAIVKGLHRCLNISKSEMVQEIGYNEAMSKKELSRKLSVINAKLCIIVIPNTVGRMDVEIAKYLLDANMSVCVLLSRSDEMIDNLKKQEEYYGNYEYVQMRQEAARNELQKMIVNTADLHCFTTSAFVLSGSLNDVYVTQEQDFLNFASKILNLSA